MVRLLVEEARDALPLPNRPQCRRNVRFVISTSSRAPIPRSGFVLRPHCGRQTVYKAIDWGSWKLFELSGLRIGPNFAGL
ncbi:MULTISPECIES: hypothetical protein [unclassified Mesorhizobium]|uniref:hypothetical protein n=1 Tax=unclassified Mesorhizobium TaxID=325217 RepID=UPI00112CD16A|nr:MULTISPECIES: hypothetical protein [unclassified Mesorhizobium]TPM07358.1 hypothetical protein FJ939_10040 [Mesorhizobium sp. B2-3-8]TPM16068.1 hypothetical protein FJ940_11855 [Mesorhizobium sp. B2-3-7]